jgi:hypothetical protein
MNYSPLSARYGLAAPLWLIVANTSSSRAVQVIAGITAVVCATTEILLVLRDYKPNTCSGSDL